MKMRRADREITDDKTIDAIIRECKVCRVGFIDHGEVYIVPMNFGYVHENGKRVFYFHSAKEGRKVDLIQSKPAVGFELDTSFTLWEAATACKFSAGYQSIIGNGIIRAVEDAGLKEKALTEIMATYTGKRDWHFAPEMMHAVSVFELEVIKISCKKHMR